MEFNSFAFLLFFLGVLLAYQVTPNRWKSGLLLMASLAFYGHWNPLFLVVLLAVVTTAYFAGVAMDRSPSKRGRIMAAAVIAILLILGVFKYASFLSNSFLFLAGDTLSDETIHRLDALLPIGISFYSFQALSYIVDVNQGKVKVEHNPTTLGLYLAFFLKSWLAPSNGRPL